MEINNRPSTFLLVKTGIFSPAVPQAGLKTTLPHQYQRLSILRKERVILDDYIFPLPLLPKRWLKPCLTRLSKR